jgi:hypothetical protein
MHSSLVRRHRRQLHKVLFNLDGSLLARRRRINALPNAAGGRRAATAVHCIVMPKTTMLYVQTALGELRGEKMTLSTCELTDSR